MIDLQPLLEEARQIASNRGDNKVHYDSTRLWNRDSHFIGVLAELTYAGYTGEAIDRSIRPAGDNGTDFALRDVKGSTYATDPHLRLNISDLKKPALFFVLVAIDQHRMMGEVIGYAHKHKLIMMHRHKMYHDYGHGPRLVLNKRGIIPGLDPIGAEYGRLKGAS